MALTRDRIMRIGKHKGRRYSWIMTNEPDYTQWTLDLDPPITGHMLMFTNFVKAWSAHYHNILHNNKDAFSASVPETWRQYRKDGDGDSSGNGGSWTSSSSSVAV